MPEVNLGEDADIDVQERRKHEPAPNTIREGLGRVTIDVEDYDGVMHHLPVLRNRDIEEVEAFVGGWSRYYDDDVKVRNANYLLWCSIRNEGLTKEQRLKSEWKYTLDEVKDMFGGLGLLGLMAVTSKLLNAAGFVTRVTGPAGEEAPSSGPLDPTVASGTGATSTPAPAPSA